MLAVPTQISVAIIEKHDKCGSRTHKRVTQATQNSLVSSILILYNLRGLLICMNALTNAKPSRVIINSFHGSGERIPRIRRGGKTAAPIQRRNVTGTCRTREICCSRLAPIRSVPVSYLCNCWRDTPIASPSTVRLMLSMSLPMRTRLPTCLSVGFGDFFVIVKLFRLTSGA
jgi:hypothetical protein